MGRILPKLFFERSAIKVARDLLGSVLARRMNGKIVRLVITETEAYEGPRDRASHASRGQTPRNRVMFGSPGVWYVYFVYGIHWMLNIVTGREGYPSAVLIRAAHPYRGPARLTRALCISGKLNGKEANRKSGLWLERGVFVSRKDFVRTPRIGVAYAGPLWSKKLYRFLLTKEVKR